MKFKTDEPHIPASIQEKIKLLSEYFEKSQILYDEIFEWYDAELKSYDSSANASDELFDPSNGYLIEGISELEILEGLSKLQVFNESRSEEL